MKILRKNYALLSIILYMFVTTFIICKYSLYTGNLNEQIQHLDIEIVKLENRLSEVEKYIEENVNDVIEEDEEIWEPAFYLSDSERRIVENIVSGESKGESYDGQVLVAQCILNACLKDGIQPSEVRTKYKYSGWDENPSESVKEAVRAVFDDNYKITEEFILYFYAPKYAKGKWHETQRFIIEVGGHRFFAEWDN